jgi:hypothetical protein
VTLITTGKSPGSTVLRVKEDELHLSHIKSEEPEKNLENPSSTKI